VPETFSSGCANDYTCCTRAFCGQKQFNEMFAAFKIKANQTFRATAYRRRNTALVDGTTRSFVFSATAQLAPGVAFPPEVLILSPCEKDQAGAYELKAETMDGKSWEYSAKPVVAGGGAYFHGYPGASMQAVSFLCGINAEIPHFKCVLAPTIADGGKLKRFGA